MTMQPLKARVKNGRLVLDEPTDLPEGEEIFLVPVGDELPEDQRAALDESLRESVEQMRKGQMIDGEVAFAELRAHR